MNRDRFQFFKPYLWACLLLFSLSPLPGCIGASGETLLGPGIGGPPENSPSSPLPAWNGSAAPDVMGPKADDAPLEDPRFARSFTMTERQRLRGGGANSENAPIIDPEADPLPMHIPPDGILKLLIEVVLKSDPENWRSDLIGPKVRILFLPNDSNGRPSYPGYYRDGMMEGRNAEGWNVVFPHLNLGSGELSIWYYENAAKLLNDPEEVLFFPPSDFYGDPNGMAPIDSAGGLQFVADPFAHHLGHWTVNGPIPNHNQPDLPNAMTPVILW